MKDFKSIYNVNDKRKRTIEEIGRILSLVYRRQYEMIGESLRKIGLTALHSVVLVNIYRYPGLNQNELAELISIDKATVSRILSNLELKDLIYKEPNDIDHRFNKLFITKLGEQKVKESLDIQVNLWIDIVKDIPQSDLEELVFKLNQLRKCFGF